MHPQTIKHDISQLSKLLLSRVRNVAGFLGIVFFFTSEIFLSISHNLGHIESGAETPSMVKPLRMTFCTAKMR